MKVTKVNQDQPNRQLVDETKVTEPVVEMKQESAVEAKQEAPSNYVKIAPGNTKDT